MNLQRLQPQALGLHGYTEDFLCAFLLLLWCSCGTPNCGSWSFFDSFTFLWVFFFLLQLGCLSSLNMTTFACLIVSCYFFCLFDCGLLEVLIFLKKKQRLNRIEFKYKEFFHWKKIKIWFSLRESYWVYKLILKVGPMPWYRWTTQINSATIWRFFVS